MLLRSSKNVILGNNILFMTTRFTEVTWGLQYTEAFLHIDTIKTYIQNFQNGREMYDSDRIKESIAFSAQNAMEQSIKQHIRISDKLAKEELFDYLTEWANYFEYNLNNPLNIEKAIEKYNENRLIEYNNIIEADENKFKETNEYKTLNHLDYYEVNYGLGSRLIGIIQSGYLSQQKRLVQYHKFFEAPDPDLIDIDFLPQYLELINPIISRCVNIAKKKLSYLKGENEKKQLTNSEVTPTPALIPIYTNRLRVSLNTEQLAVLFRLLYDCNVITSNKKEIHGFVADHIQTVGMSKQRISSQNFGKLFSSKNSEIRTFWIARLTKMIESAQKK